MTSPSCINFQHPTSLFLRYQELRLHLHSKTKIRLIYMRHGLWYLVIFKSRGYIGPRVAYCSHPWSSLFPAETFAMSFGASPSDIFLVIKLVHGAYCKWRDASGEYAEVTSLLKNAKAVLHQIRNSKDKSNVLDAQGSEIGGVLQSCHSTVSTLDEIFEEYEDLSEVRSGVRSNWQRMKFGHKRDVLSK